MKLHTSRGSVTQKIECHWENSLSFVEVKTDSSEDCKRSLALQSLRYTVSKEVSRFCIETRPGVLMGAPAVNYSASARSANTGRPSLTSTL